MASTFTTNVQLEEPARGDDVGTWDTPVNNNMTLIDLIVGGITTQTLNNSNIVLSAAQFKCRHITFNSTLTGSVTITFPTSFTKSYEIENLCTGSSAFTVTLQTTASGGQVICAPPGETIECWNDGSNIKFKNLARVGQYWDYGGSSVPSWVSGCTVPPYLNCDASSFSSATYPQLAILLGGTTLPDFRGRYNCFLDTGSVHISSAGAGVNATTIFNTGGANGVTLAAGNIPQVSGSNSITVQSSGNSPVANGSVQQQPSPSTGGNPVPWAGGGTWSAATGFTGTNTITVGNASPSLVHQSPPTIVGGIRMIRAA